MEVTNFKCDICGELYENFDHHIRQAHKPHKTFKCDVCKKSFSAKKGVKLHKISVHNKIKSYSCESCDKSFYTKVQLTSHSKITHEGIKKYECEYCQKSFGFNSSLKVHLKIMHEKTIHRKTFKALFSCQDITRTSPQTIKKQCLLTVSTIIQQLGLL